MHVWHRKRKTRAPNTSFQNTVISKWVWEPLMVPVHPHSTWLVDVASLSLRCRKSALNLNLGTSQKFLLKSPQSIFSWLAANFIFRSFENLASLSLDFELLCITDNIVGGILTWQPLLDCGFVMSSPCIVTGAGQPRSLSQVLENGAAPVHWLVVAVHLSWPLSSYSHLLVMGACFSSPYHYKQKMPI